jgi:hypothetical protein
MANEKQNGMYGGRLRVTTYIPPEAWEQFSHLAIESGQSVSTALATLVYKHLDKNGRSYDREDTTGRAPRSNFAPHATLSAALRARQHALERQAERVAAKLEKVRRLKGKP